jgi:hypothetical protein
MDKSSVKAVLIKNGKRITSDGGKTWSIESENVPAVDNNKLSVYPNPVSVDKINVILPANFNGMNFDVKVCDIFGKCLLSESFSNHQADAGIVDLDLKDIGNGYYLLRIYSGANEFITSIVVNR